MDAEDFQKLKWLSPSMHHPMISAEVRHVPIEAVKDTADCVNSAIP